jgi:hypothetical protein
MTALALTSAGATTNNLCEDSAHTTTYAWMLLNAVYLDLPPTALPALINDFKFRVPYH